MRLQYRHTAKGLGHVLLSIHLSPLNREGDENAEKKPK